ncbi:MAG: hypothetical protein AMXMBFR84_34550 [Candidatus Hydrogenedentota bacterium]
MERLGLGRRRLLTAGLFGVTALSLMWAHTASAGILGKIKEKTGGGKSEEAAPAEESAPATTTSSAGAAAKGPKQVVCVMPFEGAGKLGWDEGPVLSTMLGSALMDTGRFLIVERQQLDTVLTEQDLGAAGRINSQTALKIGNIVGASYLIQGTVTQFEPGESGQSGRVTVPIGGVGIGLGGSKVTSSVKINLRIVDLETSVVLMNKTAEAEATHKSVGMDVYSSYGSVGGDQFKKTPLGETSELAIKKAVDYIVAEMANQPFTARVAEVEGSQIYINAGSNRNVEPGLKLAVYKRGKEILDPDTGLVLDVKMTKTGVVQVDDVMEKMSICSLVEGEKPEKGSTLRLEK